MEIPQTLTMCGKTWTIVPSAAVANTSNVHGSTDFRTQTIYLDPLNTPEQNEQTLMHEMTHIVFDHAAFRHRPPFDDSKTEEAIVDALSAGLHQALKENKMLTW